MKSDDRYSRFEYRRLITWPKRLEREAPLLLETLATGPSHRVLDLGCGTGEHARFLVEEGFEVVGIDSSPSMLQKARDRPLPAGLTLVEGDLEDLDAIAHGWFGGAICLGNTIPHLDEERTLRAFLTGLRAHLLPDAPLIMQLLNYEAIFARQQRYLPLNFREDDDGEIVFLRLMELREDGRVVFYPNTLRLRSDGDPPLEVKASKRVLLRGWRSQQLEGLLVEAGFRLDLRLGGYGGEPFDPRASTDLVLVAR